MSALNLFLPLAKVDSDQRLVYGIATAEVADRDGEICDYESTKPYYESWSAGFIGASGGKSLGALRAMHGKVAAGKLTDISFDDAAKRILIAAKIVDDEEWRKVEEGVYTGFSQGGRYVRRWPDSETGATRYTAEPREISLVDLPALASATFEVIKGGQIEKRAFAAKATLPSPDPQPQAKIDPIDDEHSPAIALAELLARAEKLNRKLKRRIKTLRQINGWQNADASEAAPAQKAAGAGDALAKYAPDLTALSLRVAALEAQPIPARAALRAIAKSSDFYAGGEASSVESALRRLAELAPDERAHALMKLSLSQPSVPRL